jgi:hypothetical protein
MISILAILTNSIRYRYGIDASGIEAEPARTRPVRLAAIRTQAVRYCGGITCAMRQDHPEDSLIVIAVCNFRDLPSTW